MKCRCSVPGKQTGFLSSSSERSGKSAQPRTLPGFLLLAVVQDNRQENQQPLLADRVTPDFETTTTTGRTARRTRMSGFHNFRFSFKGFLLVGQH